MRVDIKKISLLSAIIAVFLWFVIVSICIVDLQAVQGHLVDSVVVMQDSLSDLYDYVLEPFGATQVSLSGETKRLVEDLRWKHYPFQAVQLEEWWEQQYPYLWFEDGVLYMTTEDTVWFIEMQRKEG